MWDASTVATLDSVTQKFRDKSETCEIIGLDGANQLRLERLSGQLEQDRGEVMWFDSWDSIVRVLIVGVLAYLAMVAIVRLSGKRTLSQLNAFDLIVSVSMGSVLATTITSPDLTLAEGLTAFALLAGMQYLLAWVSSKRPSARAVVTSNPTVLVRDGRLLPEAIADNRLVDSEILQAIRSSGVGDLSAVRAVVLETDGTLSVIGDENFGDGSALRDV